MMSLILRSLGVAAGLSISICGTMPAFFADDEDVATTFYNQILSPQKRYNDIRENKAFVSYINWENSTRTQVAAGHFTGY